MVILNMQPNCDISQYYGVYRECIPHPDDLAASLRDEWDRKLPNL
jgi:hypothetical protein